MTTKQLDDLWQSLDEKQRVAIVDLIWKVHNHVCEWMSFAIKQRNDILDNDLLMIIQGMERKVVGKKRRK